MSEKLFKMNPSGFFTYEKGTFTENPPIFFCEVNQNIQLDISDSECILDLQSGNNFCYMADVVKKDGKEYIYLIGNGWLEKCGFPYFPDIGYPVLAGKLCEKMKKMAEDDCIPKWENIFENEFEDLYLQISK